MKRIIRWGALWQLIAVFALAACTADEWEAASVSGTADVVQITASIASQAGTRMQVGDKGNEAFQLNDQMSLFVTPKEQGMTALFTRTLELTATGWSLELTWQEIKSEQAKFTAFYPLVSNPNAETFVHSVATDQRTKEAYAASDLLSASVEASKGAPVALEFQHRLSLIALHLTSEHTFTAEQLEQATVRVHACPSVEVRVADGEISAPKRQPEVEDVFFHPSSGGVYYVILPPQPIQDIWREGWIDITIGQQTYTYKAPLQLNGGDAFTALQPGQQLTLRLKLDKNQPVDDWAGKTMWTYGLKNMPPADEWGYAFSTVKGDKRYSTMGLKWKAGYGWYDCNKTNPSAGSGGDSEMCWAAAASNMIHWWLDQNKEYVDRLGYDGPKDYIRSTESAVFNLYKEAFYNEGQHSYNALNWFFTGCPMEIGVENEVKHGFFKAVFGEKTEVTTYVSISDDDAAAFSARLKQAFQNQEAIECTILFKSGYLHAINLWGAKFDEKGEISHIYITDNNDTDLDSQPEHPYLDRFQTQAGILEKAVRYEAGGGVLMESSNPGDFSFRIIQITTLGLKKKEWEAYFKAHAQ